MEVDHAAVTEIDSNKERNRGDIVEEYPHLVIPFIIIQVVSWIFGFLQIFNVIGEIGYATMDALYPIDISFCQMMFWGTLHYGPIEDGRLAMVCRIAFVLEGICFIASCLAITRPTTIFTPTIVSVYKAIWWFLVFGPFAAWIGTVALQIGRRRLVDNLKSNESLSKFSSIFLRNYIPMLFIQLIIVVWSVWQTAVANTQEEQIYASRLCEALRAFSHVFSQFFGWKAVLLSAAGLTVEKIRNGKAPKAVYAGIFCAVLYVVLCAFNLFLVLLVGPTNNSQSSDILAFPNFVITIGLENVPMCGVWLFGAYNFGLKPGHLLNLERTENKLKNRRESSSKATIVNQI